MHVDRTVTQKQILLNISTSQNVRQMIGTFIQQWKQTGAWEANLQKIKYLLIDTLADL